MTPAFLESDGNGSGTRIVEGLARRLLRIGLFLFTVTVACPIRYWPLGSHDDETWVFAINYAQAHGLVLGRDIFWTTGPLGYMVFPQDIGNNLIHGLVFQTLLWCGLIATFTDLFFRGRFPLFNLAIFVFLFALSAPLYWFNFMGAENLLLAAVLILLVVFQWRGGFPRYVAALTFAGIIPLIKFTGGMIVAGALAGFLAQRLLRHGRAALREVACAALIPAAVTLAGSFILMPSSASFSKYLRATLEVTRGYSEGMSLTGPRIELFAAAATLLAVAGLLILRAGIERVDTVFYGLLLAVPFFISVKHGFVRQDLHVINFFCFAALAMALICLTASFQGYGRRCIPFLTLFAIIWTLFVFPKEELSSPIGMVTGRNAALFLRGALDFGGLRSRLQSAASDYPERLRIEPEVQSVIGDAGIASLSVTYANLAVADVRLMIYPAVQRYGAYTPYLDGLNANWVRKKGPKFLLFDGTTINQRSAWAETPGMWIEVYRWYNTRLLGRRNLLLERRMEPRFGSLQSIGRSEVLLSHEIHLPSAEHPLFWAVNWRPNLRRSFLQLFWRIPEVSIVVSGGGGQTRRFRVIPQVLAAPVLGHLPSTLSELAAVFQENGPSSYSGARLQFEGPGMNCYAPTAELEFFRPAPD